MLDRLLMELPGIKELFAQRVQETRQTSILITLEARFGIVPPETAAELRLVTDEPKLQDLFDVAIVCPDLAAFQARLRS
jgi:hypothetical protein